MNGDFEDNKFADISGDEGGSKKRKKMQSKNLTATAEFTSEGLPVASSCHVDKDGNVLGKVGKEEEESQPDSDQEEENEKQKEEEERDMSQTRLILTHIQVLSSVRASDWRSCWQGSMTWKSA